MINREGADSVRLVRRPPLPSPLPSRREEGWSTQHASSRRRPPAPPAWGAHYGGNEGKNGTGCYCASPGQPKNFSTAKICPKTLPPFCSTPAPPISLHFSLPSPLLQRWLWSFPSFVLIDNFSNSFFLFRGELNT